MDTYNIGEIKSLNMALCHAISNNDSAVFLWYLSSLSQYVDDNQIAEYVFHVFAGAAIANDIQLDAEYFDKHIDIAAFCQSSDTQELMDFALSTSLQHGRKSRIAMDLLDFSYR